MGMCPSCMIPVATHRDFVTSAERSRVPISQYVSYEQLAMGRSESHEQSRGWGPTQHSVSLLPRPPNSQARVSPLPVSSLWNCFCHPRTNHDCSFRFSPGSRRTCTPHPRSKCVPPPPTLRLGGVVPGFWLFSASRPSWPCTPFTTFCPVGHRQTLRDNKRCT